VVNPLRLSPERFRLWSGALILVGLVQIVSAWQRGLSDWRGFSDAGRHVGSTLLVHPAVIGDVWAYPPATAFLYAPLAHLPPPFDFAANEVLLLACAIGAGFVAARVFALGRATAVAMVLAWGPVSAGALVIGQNSPLGLLLAMVAVLGFARGSVLLTAIPIGLLLYKPTYALPLIFVLLVRARARELAVVAGMAVLWYLASVAAAGGDWSWPVAWLHQISFYQDAELNRNGLKALDIPVLLRRAGAGLPLIAVVVAVAAAMAVLPLRRVSAVEAGCAACLIGLALSPHAWGYDGALALPMIFFAATHLPEPHRTGWLAAAYLVSPLTDLKLLPLDPLTPFVIGGAVVWTYVRWPRRLSAGPAAITTGGAAES
jgi:hypothetical protein